MNYNHISIYSGLVNSSIKKLCVDSPTEHFPYVTYFTELNYFNATNYIIHSCKYCNSQEEFMNIVNQLRLEHLL